MPLNDQAGRPRKAVRNFASFRATFARSTNPVTELEQKPVPKLFNAENKIIPNAPTVNVDRRQNRMSIFDMFSKPKVERARGYGNEPALYPLQERPQTPAYFYTKPDKPLPQPMETATQPPSVSRLSGSTLTSSQSPASIKSPRSADDWDPPPLFQAYPQSVKHGTLLGTNLSADVIRGQQLKRHNAGLFGSTTSLPFVHEGSEDHPNKQEQSWQSLGLIPAAWEGPELVSKVFVLVTAGRLVQYAGDGNYDRMPEKVLQLGEKSAAFACDLIPGKHWVVQVLQSVDGEGTTMNKSRSLLSRLRIPNSAMRKTASSFLLIFSSAEDMDFWLKAIRKVIQQINGKGDDIEAETKHSRKNTAEKLDNLPTHRFRVQKIAAVAAESITQSSSFHSQAISSTQPTSAQPPATSVRGSTHSTENSSPRHSASDTDGHSSQPHRETSTEASSLATTPASTDQMRLDQLRDGSCHSIISARTSRTSATDTMTVPASRRSSSPPSPHAETFIAQQPSPPRRSLIRTSYIQPISNAGHHRRSMQSTLVHGSEKIVRYQRQSAVDHDKTSPVLYAQATLVPSTVLENPRSRRSQTYPRGLPNRDQYYETKSRTRAQRPESTLGQLPNIANRSMTRIDQPRRQLFRPLPIRPSETTREVHSLAPEAPFAERLSSPPNYGPTPPILPAGPPAASTRLPRPPSYSLMPTSYQQGPWPSAPPVKRLQRPTSLQIRSDPAPFLSSRSRQPSLSRSPPDSPAPTTQFDSPASASPPVLILNPSRPSLVLRTPMMVPGLPPPAPPPDCPLPAPPPHIVA